MKRILSIVAAIALLVTFMVPAFADGPITPTYAINVANARNGETYAAYKIFDVTYDGQGAYTYTYTSATYGGDSTDDTKLDKLIAELARTDFVVLTAVPGVANTYLVTAGTAMAADTANGVPAATAPAGVSTDVASYFAKKLQALYKDTTNAWFDTSFKEVERTAVTTASSSAVATEAVISGGAITLPLDEDGYYFVTTTQGSFVSVDTADTTAYVKDKVEAPNIEKTIVGEDADGYNYGETINYKLTVTAHNGAVNYKVVDTCPLGITLDNSSIAVKDVTNTAPVTLTAGVDYVLTVTDEVAANRTAVPAVEAAPSVIQIQFNKSYLDTITEDTTIEITYTATVDQLAQSGSDTDKANQNVAKLYWGANTEEYDRAEENFVTAEIVINKVDAQDNNIKLAGVQFKVYTSATGTDVLNFTWNETENIYYCSDDANITSGTTQIVTTDSNGQIHLDTLKAGDYWLEEIQTNAGYNLPTARLKVRADADTSITAGGNLTDTQTNSKGVELPETGGIGTIIFVTLGSIAVLAAGIFLISNKRISKEEL